MGFEVSKSEYERFLKWKNEVDNKEEKVTVTMIKHNNLGYDSDPNEFYDGEVCKIVSLNRDLKSMGVDRDFVKELSALDSWKEIADAIEKEYGRCIFKLADVYSHGGVCVHFTDLEKPSKQDLWDSSLSALVFIPVDEAVKMEIHGIKNEKELTPEILKDEFSNYENLVNAYLSGEGTYLASEYEIPKSIFIEGYKNNCLEKFLVNYGTVINGPIGCDYYIDGKKEDKVREINDQFGSSLVYYPDSYDGEIIICQDESLKVEDILGLNPDEKQTKSRSR